MNSQVKDKATKASLESRIALFWLHRLGIVALVFGVVFLITYSIQFMSPAAAWLAVPLKLSVGAIVSLVLLIMGGKISQGAERNWFGHALTAGGWSLAYFTAYAACYIPSVKVISSLPAATLLLSSIAVGTLYSALKTRSELMAIYSITLASATILMNGPGLNSDISFVIIALVAAILGNTQSWRKLFAYGLAACYIGHFYCTSNGFSSPSANFDFNQRLTVAAFLSAIWLTFSAAIGFTRSIIDGKQRNDVTILACINAALFALGLALISVKSVETIFQLLFVVFGMLYLVTFKWLRARNHEQLSTVHALLGLSFINAAKLMHYTGISLLTFDVIQIALLAVISMRFQIKPFRWVAAILALIFFPLWLTNAGPGASIGSGASLTLGNDYALWGFQAFKHARIGALAASIFALLAVAYRASSLRYSYFYYFAANCMAALVICNTDSPSIRALGLALLAVANFGAGLRAKDECFIQISLLPLAFSIFLSMLNANNWQTLPIALLVAAYYLGHYLGRTHEKDLELASSLQSIFVLSGHLFLTALIFVKAPGDFVSAYLGLEGIAMIGCGLLLKDSFFRWSGLAVMAILTGKLLFFDLAHHNTLERILSFIAAGLVFLLTSYVYSRFVVSDSESDLPTESEPPNYSQPSDQFLSTQEV